jgi:glycosyltransferase involved in cell wall biosynthesis
MKLSIIIPVFNEEATLEKILSRVADQKHILEIIVVNDGSTDKTAEILKNLKHKKIFSKKLKTLNHKINLGKGSAIRTGINSAKGDYVLIQDADLEYNPDEYNKLTKIVSPRSCVYGSRTLGKNPHAYLRTYLGNIVITTFCNLLFFSKLTDTYTCFKLIPTKIAKRMKLNSKGFEIEAEITGKLLKNKIKITEIPIGYKPRSYKKGKKIKAKDAIKGALKFFQIRLLPLTKGHL